MHDLEISWRGGRARFGPDDSPVVIGRSSTSSVVVSDGIVSRRHLTFSWQDQAWRAEDVSTHGCYDPIGVRLSAIWKVGTDTVIRLGSTEGPELSIRPISRALSDRLNEAGIYQDPQSPPTMIDFGPPPAPAAPSAHPNSPTRSEPAQGSLRPADNRQWAAPDVAPDRQVAPDLGVGAPSAGRTPLGFERPVLEEPGTGGTNRAYPEATGAGPIDLRPDRQGVPLPSRPGPGAMPSPSADGTGRMSRPAGADRANPAATMVETDTLRLSVDGDDFVLMPGHEVTVGRDPRCTVHIDERHTLVSRNHLRFRYMNGGWWLEDTSSKGTYIDGRAITAPYKVEGAFLVEMGDPRAGTELRVVAAGTHKPPRNLAAIAVAVAAASALVLVSLLAWLIFRGDSTEATQLEQSKRATVMLLGSTGQGSGFFVTDSLIVTNQHVAALSDQLVVAVTEEVDEPATIAYVAELVENHPYLDVAVVRVTNRAEINAEGSVAIGEAIDGTDQPVMDVGDSSALTLGDSVYSTGFPGNLSISSADDEGNLRLSPVATTRGEAENLTIWPGCSNPDLTNFIPADAPPTVTCATDGDVEEAVLIASFTSGQGASGSPVVADGEVVAVVFAGSDTQSDVSRSITSNAFSDWLSGVISTSG